MPPVARDFASVLEELVRQHAGGIRSWRHLASELNTLDPGRQTEESEKVVLRSERDEARALLLQQIQATVPQAIATMLPRDLFAIVFPAAKTRLDKYLPRSRGGCSDATLYQSGSYVSYTFRSSCP